jgi:hypothetical protein
VRRAATLLSLVLALSGCASSSSRTDEDPSLPRPPGVAQVRQASSRLHASIRSGLSGRWPARLTRSRDFPELPLVQRPALRDLGAWATDKRELEAALDAELRREGELRLAVDEAAVPDWLRDPPAKQGEGELEGDPGPSLTLESWLSSEGRIGLRLREAGGEVLVVSLSEPAPQR